MAWTPIGNSGNACDPQSQGCFGAVGYSYSIGTYEATNGQYAEFLNAKAKSDPFFLYNSNMEFINGIRRTGSPGNYTYTMSQGLQNGPIGNIDFPKALRFANWMNNGQGNGDTETGAYTLLGGSAATRNPGATIVLPSEDEWYKAAYYDPSTASYFDYPTGSDTSTTCSTPTTMPNSANCGGASGFYTYIGSYPGSASPYGTFDQGGNNFEWTETISGSDRVMCGGNYALPSSVFAAANRYPSEPGGAGPQNGFRLAMIPEPSTGLLVIAGLLGFAGWRRARVPSALGLRPNIIA
jgi:formylglycine-generating enzyme required for sulfatase activity